MSMKKLIIALLMMAAVPACAQRIDKPGEPYEYFIYVEPISDLSGKFKAKIDLMDKKGRDYLVDENNKKIEFNSESEVINYMTKRGWKFVDVIVANKQYDILFKKEVHSDSEAKSFITTDK